MLARALAHERMLERMALARVSGAASAERGSATGRCLSTAAPFTGRKARVAVLGCGGWTQGWHLPNLGRRADAEIVAVVDPSEHPGSGARIIVYADVDRPNRRIFVGHQPEKCAVASCSASGGCAPGRLTQARG